MTTDVSLYDLLAGDRRQMRLVTRLCYQKAVADDLLRPYFVHLDLDRLAGTLAEFLAMAFGGPDAYGGRDLRTAHAHLRGLTDAHFDQMVDLLAEALREFGVGDGDIATVAAVAETLRDDVLNR
jgi:hemoglobin